MAKILIILNFKKTIFSISFVFETAVLVHKATHKRSRHKRK
jgi:hypothetical protein